MPWPKDHKARTRERIVQAAAGAFRARGVSGVRVEEIMSAAGLTHGGFYAHFKSKDELVGEALECASGQTLQAMQSALEGSPDDERRLLAVVDAYLSREHAAHPERGCPVAALAPELTRAGGRPQRLLAQGIKARLEWMRGLLPGGRRTRSREDELVGTLACMVGGLILARAVGGEEQEALLASCRRFVRRGLAEPGK